MCIDCWPSFCRYSHCCWRCRWFWRRRRSQRGRVKSRNRCTNLNWHWRFLRCNDLPLFSLKIRTKRSHDVPRFLSFSLDHIFFPFAHYLPGIPNPFSLFLDMFWRCAPTRMPFVGIMMGCAGERVEKGKLQTSKHTHQMHLSSLRRASTAETEGQISDAAGKVVVAERHRGLDRSFECSINSEFYFDMSYKNASKSQRLF